MNFLNFKASIAQILDLVLNTQVKKEGVELTSLLICCGLELGRTNCSDCGRLGVAIIS